MYSSKRFSSSIQRIRSSQSSAFLALLEDAPVVAAGEPTKLPAGPPGVRITQGLLGASWCFLATMA